MSGCRTAAGRDFQADGQHVGCCVLGNREDQIVTAGSGGPWRRDDISAVRARASFDAACWRFDLDFGTRNRFVAREPVDVKDELAAARHRDQLEEVGGGFGSRHRSHGDRSGRRAVVVAFVRRHLGTPRGKRQARREQHIHISRSHGRTSFAVARSPAWSRRAVDARSRRACVTRRISEVRAELPDRCRTARDRPGRAAPALCR